MKYVRQNVKDFVLGAIAGIIMCGGAVLVVWLGR